MKNILITGSTGMLGCALVQEWAEKYRVFATASSSFPGNPADRFREFDLQEDDYKSLTDWSKPEVIVHCAALVDGDYCQVHPDEAAAVNGHSVMKLLAAAPQSKIIYVSTDMVFPERTKPAAEQNEVNPPNTYGQTKALGEKYLLESSGFHNIIRTTIIGKNINPKRANKGFIGWIISSLSNRKKITLFEDVYFNPISIWHLAEELSWVIENKCPKILHISGGQITTKYELGHMISEKLKLDCSLIEKGKLSDAPLVAKRNRNLTLDCSVYQSLSGHSLPNTAGTVKILLQHYREARHAEI